MSGAPQPDLDRSPARVLLGWMDTEHALRVQHDSRADVPIAEASRERLRAAREQVAARPCGIDQGGAVTAVPAELQAYVDALRGNAALAEMFAEGWTPSLVDLRRICAVQPRVFTDHGDERIRAVEPEDLGAIAAITMPVPGEQTFPAHFDEARGAWVLSSADPNLKVVSQFGRQLGPDVAGFGFGVALGRSYLKAVQHNGRYFLTDGYHRAVAFLRRGITHVPALTRTLPPGEPLEVPHGMLPADAYQGDRPPLLADFLDDAVSMALPMLVRRKVIVIQAIEVMV